MKELYGKCGCNCARCPGFAGNARDDETRQFCSDGWFKYLGARLKPESIHCLGCQAPNPWRDGNVLPDRGCVIRPCAIETGVKTCAQCAAFPCGVHGQDIDREQVAARTGEPIPEKEYLAFIKPYARVKNLHEIRASLAREDIVPVAEVKPIRARIVAFPDDLPLSEEEVSALRSVHQLVSDVQSARADIYARQLQRKRRRPHMLALLWPVGFYGDLDEEAKQLVLDGTVHRKSREYSWFVRKRDNAFFGAQWQAAGFLRDLGADLEYTPLKKGWLLKLSLDERAGGEAALKALKRYAVALGEKHGEPVYAGNSRYKGKAYTRFSRADMHVFGEPR